jgi:hypothetical protein
MNLIYYFYNQSTKKNQDGFDSKVILTHIRNSRKLVIEL